MPSNYFDVVVIGMKLEALLCAALLAKRGFRVLVVGHGDLGPTYEIGGMTLPRAPNPRLPSQSPAVRRVLRELALYQTFRRRTTVPDPTVQLVMPGHRFEFAARATDLESEVEREFPEVKRPVEDFHRDCIRVSDGLDQMLERDLIWPPELFFERREFSRASTLLPLDRTGAGPKDPIGEFPERHPFRTAVDAATRFETNLDPEQIGPLSRSRAYARWLEGTGELKGGYPWLWDALVQKILTCTGDVRPGGHLERVVLRRGAAHAVRLKGADEEIGCAFIVASCELSTLLSLVPDRSNFEELLERVGEPQTAYYRYTLNVIVKAEGIPEGMGHRVLFVRDGEKRQIDDNLLHIERSALPNGDQLLCIETLMGRRGMEAAVEYREKARERIVGSLRELMPFLDEHLLWIDSPHDGRDAYDYQNHRLVAPQAPWTRGPRTMAGMHTFPLLGPLGACALPVRTSIRRLLLCSHQVVPGLGTEGRFLSAWTAAKIVAKADSKKEWMRRGLWTRVEL